MEFNQFVDEVKGRIKQFLPIEYEDAQVRICLLYTSDAADE